VGGTPFADDVGYEGDAVPRMNESPETCSAIWLASEIIPASATTVTSVNWWAVLNALMTGSMVAVSALVPSKASTASGKPVASVSRPMVICGSSLRSLELCRRLIWGRGTAVRDG
jgi:hypothetical protein